jgi:hypothetical protein
VPATARNPGRSRWRCAHFRRHLPVLRASSVPRILATDIEHGREPPTAPPPAARVDLLSGSPPSNVTEPATRPPPSTRSSSRDLMQGARQRCAACMNQQRGRSHCKTRGPARRSAATALWGNQGRAGKCVPFPQCGHWPCHLTDSPRQAAQYEPAGDASRAILTRECCP